MNNVIGLRIRTMQHEVNKALKLLGGCVAWNALEYIVQPQFT